MKLSKIEKITPRACDDDTLMARYGDGDMDAARILALRHSPLVMGLALRMLNDHASAEDVLQETMLRLWKVAGSWRTGEAKVSTWLYRVSSNLCLDQLKKRRGVGLDSIVEPTDHTLTLDETLQNDKRHQRLYSALQDLPERQRLAVTLRHIDGLGNREIADIMGLSLEAVESLTARGKRGLAQILRPLQDEIGYDS